MNITTRDLEAVETEHHFKAYGKTAFRFEWGAVTHPGVWACGGGRQDLPPVLVGISFQVPQEEPQHAWWCYIGPRPEFVNEMKQSVEDYSTFAAQCLSVSKPTVAIETSASTDGYPDNQSQIKGY